MDKVRAALDKIAERRPSLIDLGLTRMQTALTRLGDPHKKIPPVFHVAGTNGKGSTIAFLKAILEASGARVHVFTSPHLVRYNERIVLAGREIADDDLIEAVTRVDAAVGEAALTFFETLTCAAFLAFGETPADYLILEVGLGGRLDSTNVIDRPLAAVIAPVDYDHQAFLGDNLSAIASEKAGIMRAGAPAVIGPQQPEAMAALERCAETIGADIFAYGRQWTAHAEQGRLIYQDDDGLNDLAAPRLAGAHQFLNAGLAVAAVKAAGLKIDDDVLSRGVEEAQWPARLQRLRSGPIIERLAKETGEEPEIWLDGGHNPHAARALAAALADMEDKSPRPLILISGMQSNKDAYGFFAEFDGIASAVIAVAADHNGAASPEAVAQAAARAGLPSRVSDSVEEAALFAVAGGREPPRILICGSLYLAGEVLADHG